MYEVAVLLESQYFSSNLGNKRNPLNELAYIMLSGRTSAGKYQVAYRKLRRAFPSWKNVLGVPVSVIADAIEGAGLENQKALYIKKIVEKLSADFGEVTLRYLKYMETKDAEEYLISLPGVGIKTARCILMYSLDRKVFPADVHCLRIMRRLGWIPLGALYSRSIADLAQTCIPQDLRYDLHVYFVQHGRKICKPNAKCSECVLRPKCQQSFEDAEQLAK